MNMDAFVKKILIIEDDEAMQFFMSEALKKLSYKVNAISSAESALATLEKESYDLILLDIKLPGMNGIEALDFIQEISDACVIIITAYGDKNLSFESIRKGAYDYFTKPINLQEMEITIKRALEKHRIKRELIKQGQHLNHSMDYPNIIGKCIAIKKVIEQVALVAKTDATVLIIGETGTGKELIAQAIFENSPRKNKPFVKLNCIAIPDGLIESELFGHEKGSFTGAINTKKGKFELADKGTIFLDEIGDMSLPTQGKILRILQEKEFERVGGTRPLNVDVRIITATNKNLFQEVKEKKFREDLFYRLNVITIMIPPLRERKEDIPLLTQYFLQKFSKVFGIKDIKITKEALEYLTKCPWPGNIRELENVIKRALILHKIGEEFITTAHLPSYIIRGPKDEMISEHSKEKGSIDSSIANLERGIILDTLYKTRGIQSQAAKQLGISERSLWYRIKKYYIDVDNIKKMQKL